MRTRDKLSWENAEIYETVQSLFIMLTPCTNTRRPLRMIARGTEHIGDWVVENNGMQYVYHVCDFSLKYQVCLYFNIFIIMKK